MVSIEIKNSVIEEINSLIGAKKTPEILQSYFWLELESGIWLLNETQFNFLQTHSSPELEKKLKYAGIFIGKIRRNFGLSIESLYNLQPCISRYIIIKGKTLQKYLYGKPITVTINKNNIENLDLKKIIVMTPERHPIGISRFTILEEKKEGDKTIISLKLEPITDLGMFLRKERTMFE